MFDEFDSQCAARGGGGDSTGTGNRIVNQILTMIDGVNSPPNILVIGMTNRLDMLDSAVLRAGRMEVQVMVGLPNQAGRKQILEIHTANPRAAGFIATDGCDELADLLSANSKNYSGAELKSLVGTAVTELLQ